MTKLFLRKISFSIVLSSFFFLEVAAMGGPGGGGGGDCFQFDTQGTITSCTNCTPIDPVATGDIDGDPSLVVMANGCGPVTLTVEYSFNWDQGSAFNWIHGVSFDAGPLWTNFDTGAPGGWTYMDTGVTGCCSGTSYGPGYYYDGSDLSSAGDSFTWVGTMGIMCTATWTNPTPGDCSSICDGNATMLSTSTDPAWDGLDFHTTFNGSEAAGWTLNSGANDGDPSNNWGVNCGVNLNGNQPDCPVFTFELTYCPTNVNPGDFVEYISFTTSADGESGCWCTDASCDYANGFNVTIQDACGPDASFDPIPDNYCTAPAINLNNPSAGYDNGFIPDPGAEWTGDGTVTGGPINVSFNYCDNVGATTLTHIVGENDCYDGPVTETFEVWIPEIQNENASPMVDCGAFTPTLSADIVIAGTNMNWGGGGTLVWQEGGVTVTDFTVTPLNCAPVTRTFTPVFQTGCAACDVTGTPVSVTAYPNYTENVVMNPGDCTNDGLVEILGNDGVTVCQSFTVSCPNPGDVQSLPYNFTPAGSPPAGCNSAFSGNVTCSCAGCNADAGTINVIKGN